MRGWISILVVIMAPTAIGMFFRKEIIQKIIAISYIIVAMLMAGLVWVTDNNILWSFVGACFLVSLGTFFTKQTHYLKITKWRVQKRLVTDPRK